MSKILGSWSGMRKYLEKEMLASSLKGKVRYNCTTYVGMDACSIFEVYINDELKKQFSWETVNSYFIKKGFSKNQPPFGAGDYWDGFWELMDQYPLTNRTEYSDNEFCEVLEEYRNQEIKLSLQSKNPIVRMFAILDRRVGKRTLQKLKSTIENQPDWLKEFYELRIKSELVF